MVGAAELRTNFKIRLIRQRLKENEMRKKILFLLACGIYDLIQQTHHISACKLKLSALIPGLMPLLAELLPEFLGQNKLRQLFFFSPGLEEGVGLSRTSPVK